MAEQPDPSTLSLEQLETALNQSYFATETAEPEPEPAPEPEPQPEPPVSTETEPLPVEPEATPEPAAPEPDVEAELQLARERELEARAKHFESTAGRLGGRVGFLEQRLSELLSARQAAPQEDGEPPVPQAPQPLPDRVTAWAAKRAAEDASQRFLAEHPDYAEHAPKIKDYMAARGITPASVLDPTDPVTTEQRVQQLLEEHHWHATAEANAARRATLLTKRAEQTAKAVQAKQKASASATGSAPTPKPSPKSPEQLSVEELDAEMARATKGAIW